MIDSKDAAEIVEAESQALPTFVVGDFQRPGHDVLAVIRLREERGRSGHFGLSGMHERAALVGGTLTVWSEHDSGTEVELIVPAVVAYLESPHAPQTPLSETQG